MEPIFQYAWSGALFSMLNLSSFALGWRNVSGTLELMAVLISVDQVPKSVDFSLGVGIWKLAFSAIINSNNLTLCGSWVENVAKYSGGGLAAGFLVSAAVLGHVMQLEASVPLFLPQPSSPVEKPTSSDRWSPPVLALAVEGKPFMGDHTKASRKPPAISLQEQPSSSHCWGWPMRPWRGLPLQLSLGIIIIQPPL